jgi:hypothetical protein
LSVDGFAKVVAEHLLMIGDEKEALNDQEDKIDGY